MSDRHRLHSENPESLPFAGKPIERETALRSFALIAAGEVARLARVGRLRSRPPEL